MDQNISPQNSVIQPSPHHCKPSSFYPDLAFLPVNTFLNSISSPPHETVANQEFMIENNGFGPSPDLGQQSKPIAVPTNRPINILLANGKLVRLPNLQSLFASASLILQEQCGLVDSVDQQEDSFSVDTGNADYVDDNLKILKKAQMLSSLDEDRINEEPINEEDLIQLLNTEKFKREACAKLRHLRQQLEQTEFDDSQTTIAATIASLPGQRCSDATIDGINLAEIRDFARMFKYRRLALGLTQTQVGHALTAAKGPAYSQSAICRFEKLDITPKSAAKIKPVLEKWLKDTERKYGKRQLPMHRIKNGRQSYVNMVNDMNQKKRKRRTSFSSYALGILNESFRKNTHPTGSEMTLLSNKLRYDREVIRVWFCNKRQAIKNRMIQNSADKSSIPDKTDACSNNGDESDDSNETFEVNTSELASEESDCDTTPSLRSDIMSSSGMINNCALKQIYAPDIQGYKLRCHADESQGGIVKNDSKDCNGGQIGDKTADFFEGMTHLNPVRRNPTGELDEITFADAVNEATSVLCMDRSLCTRKESGRLEGDFSFYSPSGISSSISTDDRIKPLQRYYGIPTYDNLRNYEHSYRLSGSSQTSFTNK